MRPQGWVSGASAIAYKGDMLSTLACHFGGFFGFLGCPNRRYCRSAMSRSTTPSAILNANAASDGAVLLLGGELPVARTVTATTMPSDTNHPETKARSEE